MRRRVRRQLLTPRDGLLSRRRRRRIGPLGGRHRRLGGLRGGIRCSGRSDGGNGGLRGVGRRRRGGVGGVDGRVHLGGRLLHLEGGVREETRDGKWVARRGAWVCVGLEYWSMGVKLFQFLIVALRVGKSHAALQLQRATAIRFASTRLGT
jgi:hypothetical protein